MILIKKKQINTTTTTEIFKCYKNSTVFNDQNARGKGPCGPSSGHRCLLHLEWPLITKVIETPALSTLWTSLLWL